MSRYSKDIIQSVKDAASLEDIVRERVDLRRQGRSYIGDCPLCNKKKLSLNPTKGVVKCWPCDMSATHAIAFLMNFYELDFAEAISQLAERYNIPISSSTSTPPDEISFRDAQLQASGIQLTTARYTSATVDKGFNLVLAGNDMVLHYLGLHGEDIMYTSKTRKKDQLYYRVRYRIPAHHKDKNGKPIRYASPYGAKSELWIPDVIITKCKDKTPIPTLVICEGEKKATKLCQEGIDAVGVSGIHNFDPGRMTLIFEELIRICLVERVVFLLDADWEDLSIHKSQSVDSRPRSFASAVTRFRNYFYEYAISDIYIKIYFGYHKARSAQLKGIDDFLVRKLLGKESELKASLDKAIVDREGKSTHLQLHDITSYHDYKIRDLWHLNNRQDFLAHHKDALSEIEGKFRHGRIDHRWNPDTMEFEIAQQIMPSEEYWFFEEIRKRKVCRLRHTGARNFLRSRDFYKALIPGQPMRFVHVDNKIISEIDETYIRDYVLDFTESLNQPDVLEMLLASERAFMNNKLKDMYPVDFKPLGTEKDAQLLVFNNTAVRVTESGIDLLPLGSLGGYIWKDEVIDYALEYKSQLLTIKEANGALTFETYDAKRLMSCQLFRFLLNTSNFHWRKDKMSPEDEADHMQHLTAKMIAIGYVLHNYEDLSATKAIVCMDGIESEVGQNEGGTGKSIFSTMFEHLMPTNVIDAQGKDLTSDAFLFDGIDERTRVVVLDDCRVNLDFKYFYSKIARGLMVNPKGTKKFFSGIKKWIFSTNHSLGGSDNSTRRRQYLLAFSDYYNQDRSPIDDFGCVMFREWGAEQWNLMFNLFFCCVQAYLKYGFQYGIPEENVRKRYLRKEITEEFLEWAIDYFGTPEDPRQHHVNHKIGRSEVHEAFYSVCSAITKRYNSPRHFKRRLYHYCDYAGFKYNIRHDLSYRIKSGSEEYYVVADKDCPEKPPKLLDVILDKSHKSFSDEKTPF